MAKMVKCKACGKEIASGAKCPECGKDSRNFFMKHKILTVILGLFIISGIGGAMGSSDDGTATTNNVNNSSSDQQEDQKKEEKKDEKKDDVPTEYKSALKKAKTYSDTMFMSKTGIYDQLTSEYGEKFTPEAGQYAIDNLEADWNKNALKKAQTYQKTMSMSPSAIYDQLISEHGEKFTPEQAQYAIDNLE